MIPFLDLNALHQPIVDDIKDVLNQVVERGQFVLGDYVKSFETEFAAYVEASHCVGVGNGLDAISMALEVAGIREGDEILVPSNTFIATWLAVTSVGATPIPVEPDPGTFNISLGEIEKAYTKNTKALIIVSLYGRAVFTPKIGEFCRKNELLLVEDAAQAHGARIGNARVGSQADMTTWSFYPGKNLGALGDGGAVTTNNCSYEKKLRLLRNYGSDEKYRHQVLGRNSRLDSIQAAVLSVKLPHLDRWNSYRTELAEFYLNTIKNPRIELPHRSEKLASVWHQFVIRCDDRDQLQSDLHDREIQTLIHYPTPPHIQDCYRNLGYSEGAFPIAEKLSRTMLSLPMGEHVTIEMAETIVSVLNRF